MKLLFIGPATALTAAPFRGLQFRSIAEAFRRWFDEVGCSRPEAAQTPFVAAFERAGGRLCPIPANAGEVERLVGSCDGVLVYPGGLPEMAALLTLLAGAYESDAPGPRAPKVYLYDWEKFFAPLRLQLEVAVEMGLTAPGPMSSLRVFEDVDALEDALQRDWSVTVQP